MGVSVLRGCHWPESSGKPILFASGQFAESEKFCREREIEWL